MTAEPQSGPFGARALPPALEALRRWGTGLGTGPLARRTTSLIRRLCYLAAADPFDVEPFPGQRARLHPRDNLSEKRVFAAPQFWDAREREVLAEAIAAGRRPFHFVDAGANVGLYTLAARSAAAPGQIRALAIEPDPENLSRLRFNLAASGASDEVIVADVGLADAPGELVLSEAENRGEVALSVSGEGVRVKARPLADVVRAAGMDRIDALKIDIEGMEEPVLAAFFSDAPRTLWPALVLIEARHGADTPALALLRSKGYVETERTALNVIMKAPAGPAERGASGEPARSNEGEQSDGKA